MFDAAGYPDAPPAVICPAAAAQSARVDERHRDVERRIAELMGVINAAHGELVELTGAVLDERLGVGPGVHTAQQYLAWRTGLSAAHAGDLVRIAKRRSELPACVGALVAGSITVDQAAVIARHVPAEFDRDATETGALMTVAQLKRTLPRYAYDPIAPTPSAEAPAHADAAVPVPVPVPLELDSQRTVSMGSDEHGWHAHLRLPHDEGARFEHAARITLDDLWNQHHHTSDPVAVRPTLADAVLSMAEAALTAGAAAHPGTDRYLLHLHVEQGPTANTVLTPHLGTPFHRTITRLLTCDPTWRLAIETGGTPIGTGRKTRRINQRLRRSIEHRDHGCAIPGCERTSGLEIHHIWHWEDGGPTKTHNLLTLCKRHHRLHHQRFLTITGNPNLPTGTPGCLQIHDHHGHPLEPVGQPIPLNAPTQPDPPPPAGMRAEPDPPPGAGADAQPPTGIEPDPPFVIGTGPDPRPRTDTGPDPSLPTGTGTESPGAATPDEKHRPAPEPTISAVGAPAAPESTVESAQPSNQPGRDDPCRHAAARGIPTPAYRSPLNERLDTWGFHLNPRTSAPARPNPWVQRLTQLPPPGVSTVRPTDPPSRT